MFYKKAPLCGAFFWGYIAEDAIRIMCWAKHLRSQTSRLQPLDDGLSRCVDVMDEPLHLSNRYCLYGIRFYSVDFLSNEGGRPRLVANLIIRMFPVSLDALTDLVLFRRQKTQHISQAQAKKIVP